MSAGANVRIPRAAIVLAGGEGTRLQSFKGQVNVFHESTIVAHVMIAWKNRNRAVWSLFREPEQYVENRGSCSTVLGHDHQRVFIDISQLGFVKFRVRVRYDREYGATADAKRNPPQGLL